jgi:ribose 5-phosphate isomerase B
MSWPRTARRQPRGSARAVAAATIDDEAERGVLVCGSGAGVAVAASKVRGIRAAR